mmetsp:Transcript_14156/g.40794  ORF Transcript_14156/g.40794 Transcript_14156/m.40794 type:complete len:251 (-) Transcript_14156:20-772(-)
MAGFFRSPEQTLHNVCFAAFLCFVLLLVDFFGCPSACTKEDAASARRASTAAMSSAVASVKLSHAVSLMPHPGMASRPRCSDALSAAPRSRSVPPSSEGTDTETCGGPGPVASMRTLGTLHLSGGSPVERPTRRRASNQTSGKLISTLVGVRAARLPLRTDSSKTPAPPSCSTRSCGMLVRPFAAMPAGWNAYALPLFVPDALSSVRAPGLRMPPAPSSIPDAKMRGNVATHLWRTMCSRGRTSSKKPAA